MDSLDLSRRAVAAGWRWQAGTLAMSADGEDPCGRVLAVNGRMLTVPDCDCEAVELMDSERALPDFNDAATRGALLEQVRELWDDPGICVRGMLQSDGTYHWYIIGGRAHGDAFYNQGIHDSETAALVAALESAPKEKGL